MDFNHNDLSVVVQGAIDKKNTSKCLKAIRSILPDAKIILSTWEGTAVQGLDYDDLCLSEDPGAVLFEYRSGLYNNLNRQLVSTKAGLKKVTTKFCIKIRSDVFLSSSEFIKYLNWYPAREENFKIFKERILVSSIYSRRFFREGNLEQLALMHPSDWILFGLTEDIVGFYENTVLVSEPSFSHQFILNNSKKKRVYAHAHFRYPAEQYLCQSYFEKYFPEVKVADYTEVNEEIYSLSQRILINNFTFLDPDQWKFVVLKKPYLKMSADIASLSEDEFGTLYRNYLFEEDYSKYCDPSFMRGQSDLKLNRNRNNLKNRSKRILATLGVLDEVRLIVVGCKIVARAGLNLFWKIIKAPMPEKSK